MILAMKTAGPTTELYFFDGDKKVIENIWESGRKLSTELLPTIESLLATEAKTMTDLSGIVVFRGPGSFTSLRIGITSANALGYGLGIPVVGAMGDTWLSQGLAAIKTATVGETVLPEYGAPANITTPKK